MNSTDKLRVGVVGAGKMGLLHSGIFNSINGCKLVAISDKDKFMVGALKNYLDVNIYQDYKEMIDEENLDIVINTTPVFVHRDVIRYSMKNNLSIFVEKPLAINGNECKSILSNSYSSATMVGYSRRFIKTYNLAKEIIVSGDLGKVNHFSSHILVSQVFKEGKSWLYNPKMSGGGVLIDLGSHAIDLFHYLFGDVSNLCAFAKPIFNKQVEDYCQINLQFRNGIIGSLQASWSIRNYRLPELKIEMHLDKGVITVTEKYVTIFSEVDSNSVRKGWTTLYKQDLTHDIPINIAGPEYTLEDSHFVDCVTNNKKTICDFNEAAKTNFVIDKIYSSVEKGSLERISYEG